METRINKNVKPLEVSIFMTEATINTRLKRKPQFGVTLTAEFIAKEIKENVNYDGNSKRKLSWFCTQSDYESLCKEFNVGHIDWLVVSNIYVDLLIVDSCLLDKRTHTLFEIPGLGFSGCIRREDADTASIASALLSNSQVAYLGSGGKPCGGDFESVVYYNG